MRGRRRQKYGKRMPSLSFSSFSILTGGGTEAVNHHHMAANPPDFPLMSFSTGGDQGGAIKTGARIEAHTPDL